MSDIRCSGCGNEPSGYINVSRFVKKMDECFADSDIEEAIRTVEFWENEARAYNDTHGLLSVLNEEIGLFRRTGDKQRGMRAVDMALSILDSQPADISRATIYVNIATTMKAFGMPKEGLVYFDKAEEIYGSADKKTSYEYSALLNNKSASLCELGLYDEGEVCLRGAIDILKEVGSHEVEVGVSYVNLAHLYFDRDGESYAEVERLLDLAWEYINAHEDRDGNYAFAISKCAPSFRYFRRELEADALELTAGEIYDRR